MPDRSGTLAAVKRRYGLVGPAAALLVSIPFLFSWLLAAPSRAAGEPTQPAPKSFGQTLRVSTSIDYPPDSPPTVQYAPFPATFIPPFQSPNPVTGKEVK